MDLSLPGRPSCRPDAGEEQGGPFVMDLGCKAQNPYSTVPTTNLRGIFDFVRNRRLAANGERE